MLCSFLLEITVQNSGSAAPRLAIRTCMSAFLAQAPSCEGLLMMGTSAVTLFLLLLSTFPFLVLPLLSTPCSRVHKKAGASCSLAMKLFLFSVVILLTLAQCPSMENNRTLRDLYFSLSLSLFFLFCLHC